jgi:hypothetical protein
VWGREHKGVRKGPQYCSCMLDAFYTKEKQEKLNFQCANFRSKSER